MGNYRFTGSYAANVETEHGGVVIFVEPGEVVDGSLFPEDPTDTGRWEATADAVSTPAPVADPTPALVVVPPAPPAPPVVPQADTTTPDTTPVTENS